MKRLVLLALVLSLLLGGLTACGGGAPAAAPSATQAPAPTNAPAATVPVPTTAPAPTAAPASTSAPAPTAAPAMPDGWTAKSAGNVSIVLPKDWELLDFTAGDLQKMYDSLQKSNPNLAQLVGSADALQGIALWAFSPKRTGVDFVDNVNIRKQSLEGQKIDKFSKELTDVMVSGLKDAKFEDIAATPELQVGGLSAAYLTYKAPANNASGQPMKINIEQWMVLTATDMWVMTYSAGPASGLELNPAFEKQALDLALK